MSAAQSLRLFRSDHPVSLTSPAQVVHSQEELHGVRPGVLPVLRGGADFAVGRGVLVRALDDVRVCAVEGAGVLASDRSTVVAWEGAAVAGRGEVDVTLGRGGRAWVVSDTARLRCQPTRAAIPVEEELADLQAVLYGASVATADGGVLVAGGGARVIAGGRVTLRLDRTVTTRADDWRLVVVEQTPAMTMPDVEGELERYLSATPRREAAPGRVVLLPWLAPDDEPTELFEPILQVLAADGIRRQGPWRREGPAWLVDVRGHLKPERLANLIALPPGIEILHNNGSSWISSDTHVEIGFLPGGAVRRMADRVLGSFLPTVPPPP